MFAVCWAPFHTDSHPCIRSGGPVDCIGGPGRPEVSIDNPCISIDLHEYQWDGPWMIHGYPWMVLRHQWIINVYP